MPIRAGQSTKESVADRRNRKTKVPQVGLFFVVGGKPFVEGIPWSENPSVGGFRTFGVGHPDYWRRLQDLGVAPREIPYEDVPRGRVNYLDATGRFPLLADKCIIKRKQLVRRIMAALCLPKGTAVLRDLHYKCAVCMGKVATRQQEREDWDF